MKPCTILRDALAEKPPSVVYRETNLFADGKFADHVRKAGILPRFSYSAGMRAYIHRGLTDVFVFFFSFDLAGSHEKEITFEGAKGTETIRLTLGSKTSGVLRIHQGSLAGYMVKGTNEVEGITSKIRIEYAGSVIEAEGDFSSTGR